MRTASLISSLFLISISLSHRLASAEIFKCTGADGRTSYSDSPCAAAGAKEARVPIVAGPARAASAQGRNWAAENAAANERAAAAPPRDVASASVADVQKAPASPRSTREIVAECEASRGTNCSSQEEIARRRVDDRELTPEEAAARQSAVAGRRAAGAAAQAETKAPADSAGKEQAKPPAPAPLKPGR
ncbi:MAG: DUF4124 domain-containing protein [Pseudomonadota bacterium]